MCFWLQQVLQFIAALSKCEWQVCGDEGPSATRQWPSGTESCSLILNHGCAAWLHMVGRTEAGSCLEVFGHRWVKQHFMPLKMQCHWALHPLYIILRVYL